MSRKDTFFYLSISALLFLCTIGWASPGHHVGKGDVGLGLTVAVSFLAVVSFVYQGAAKRKKKRAKPASSRTPSP
ncbi:hypothetical protein J4573_16295 [Actinomadura barringtoniae]|uniref:Uncharacterized protein n=1 Tax=Actinomadura barringtoniae TaxID=1427535 RepID=A0A939PA58_9ACTN|nr:hypothetical protein [Actinomadura barringtoniae]MBO2448663.1 hypothetical protein [Actinomadura barringtoniae]